MENGLKDKRSHSTGELTIAPKDALLDGLELILATFEIHDTWLSGIRLKPRAK